jgi:D-sedoheptulose 7-phosphate isomerase
MSDHIYQAFKDARNVLNEFMENDKNIENVNAACEAMINSINNGGKILSCGNGGSLCDSMHFAEELTGRFRKDRRALPAVSISNPAHITCVANDFGYEEIFSRGVEAWGKNGDTLLAISTSGNSENVIRAVKAAKLLGIKTVGLLGKDGGKLISLVDIPIHVPSPISDRIQEVHIKVIHILIEGIERSLFPEHYNQA